METIARFVSGFVPGINPNWLHKFVRIFAEYNILPKLVIYFDQLLGYGKQVKQTTMLKTRKWNYFHEKTKIK